MVIPTLRYGTGRMKLPRAAPFTAESPTVPFTGGNGEQQFMEAFSRLYERRGIIVRILALNDIPDVLCSTPTLEIALKGLGW